MWQVFHYRALLAFKVLDLVEDAAPLQREFKSLVKELPDVLPRVATLVLLCPNCDFWVPLSRSH